MENSKLISEFSRLIEDNQNIIFKISRMYCNNHVCREDLFQEILLQLWKSFPNFDSKRKFTTWMYRVALNTAISQFRSSQKEILSFNAELPVNIKDEVSENKEDIKILYEAIGKLNKAEKSLIILYLDNLQYTEIAEIAGISANNVGVKINRIKSKLQKILKELGYGF